ncbi:hypothetical protein [Streptomyces rochei]|uniref:hypothetical protein n=1 Tax=Streptomyces rochei TaxID=1928 RepID=UPI003691EBEC
MTRRLVDSNPELFTNPTLGEANPTTFLDEEVAQTVEDKQARRDKREPLIARREVRYPTYAPAQAVPSSTQDVVNMHDPNTNNVDVQGPGKIPAPVMENGNPPVADYSPQVEVENNSSTEEEDLFSDSDFE